LLPGFRTRDLNTLPDERGFFSEIFRQDWKDFLEDDVVVQASLIKSYPGVVRAWHRHSRGQIDYWTVVRGALKIVVYDDNEGSQTRGQIDEVVAGEERLQIVRQPGHYWHGVKVVGNEPALALYFVTRLYDRMNPDEEKRPWNDPLVIDPRTGQTYDWEKKPFK
jgi:dTDP-4-dehydrorhamnose 3,5-epimerase